MRIKQFPAEFRVILAAVALFLGWLFAAIIPYDYPLGKDWGFRLPVERLQKANDTARPTLADPGSPVPVLPKNNDLQNFSQPGKNPAKTEEKRSDPPGKSKLPKKILPRQARSGSEYIVLDETNLKSGSGGKKDPDTIQMTNKPNFDLGILNADDSHTKADWVSKGDAAKREAELRQFAQELEIDEFEEPSFEKKNPLRWEDNIKPKLEGADPAVSSTVKKEIKATKADLPKKSESASIQKPDLKVAVPEKKEIIETKKPDPPPAPQKAEGSLNQTIRLNDNKDPALELHSLNLPKEGVPGSLSNPLPPKGTNPSLEKSEIVLIPSTVPKNEIGKIRSSSHIESGPRISTPDPKTILVPDSEKNKHESVQKTLSNKDPGSIVYLKPNVRTAETVVSRVHTDNRVPTLSELRIHQIQQGENPQSLRKLYGLSEKKYEYFLSLNQNKLDPQGNFPVGSKVFIP